MTMKPSATPTMPPRYSLGQVWQQLTATHPSLDDIEMRRQSHLLANLTLAMSLASTLAGSLLALTSPNGFSILLFLVPAVLATLFLYRLNRLGNYRLAARLFVGLNFALPLLPPLLRGDLSWLFYTPLPILFCAIFLSFRTTALLYVLNILAQLGVMALRPGTAIFGNVGILVVFVITSLMVLLFMVHRSRLEHERNAQLQQINRQLRTSELELEQRVIERTREVERARAEAEKASTIKSQFLANMSHELRTPLNAILNFTGFVADEVMGPVNPEQKEALAQTLASGRHLLALINDVLDITKIETGSMDLFIQEVDFNEAVQVVIAMAKGLLKQKPIQLATEIAPHLPHSYGDKRRLRQVFLNIVSNAVKFTHEGQVTIRMHHTADKIRFEVADTGVGIALHDQHLVFATFRQAKHDSLETPGTGLGMPISKFFVEAHRGRIWFASQEGVGTTFYVELPILSEAEAMRLTDDVNALPAQTKEERPS